MYWPPLTSLFPTFPRSHPQSGHNEDILLDFLAKLRNKAVIAPENSGTDNTPRFYLKGTRDMNNREEEEERSAHGSGSPYREEVQVITMKATGSMSRFEVVSFSWTRFGDDDPAGRL